MYSQVSDLGCLPSVTSIGAVCILVYVFFGTYVEVSVCILRKRETEREKDREREVGRDKEEEKEKGGRNFQVIGYTRLVLLIIAKLLSKVISPMTLPSCSPLPMLFVKNKTLNSCQSYE